MAKLVKKVVLLYGRGYGVGLLAGLKSYFRLHGRWSCHMLPLYHSQAPRRAMNLLSAFNVNPDGIIVPNSVTDLEKIINLGLPVIIHRHVKERIPGIPHLLGKGAEIGRMAADHLLERAFDNFAYCGFTDTAPSRERAESFGETIKKAGFRPRFYMRPLKKVSRAWDSEIELLADWLKSLPKPVAIMACNDDRSRDIVQACRVANLRIPAEVALLGVDNESWICELETPTLSSVALNFERAGYEAGKLLDRLISGVEKPGDQVVYTEATHVVTRESTNIFAIKDRQIAKALHFIRQNSRMILQVGDVAEAAALSRSALKKRFRQALGRTVSAEIRTARIAEIKRALMETDMTISEIASVFGYTSDHHIHRFFRNETGMSPKEYRRKYGRK